MSSTPSTSFESQVPAPAGWRPGINEPRSLWEAIGWRALIQIIILAMLVIGVYWHSLATVVFRWRTDGNWSHGWLVPFFSLYLLHTNRAALAAATRRTNYFGLLIVVLTLVGFFATYVYGYNYPRAVSMVVLIFGVTLFLAGWGVTRVAWVPIFFLLFALPLPDSIYVQLTMPLRKLASVVSANGLALIPGVHTDVSGVVIDFSYRGKPGSLNVEEACSGMRLMMAFVTLGVAMAYMGRRPTWQRILMILVCVPIAVFCNMIRVTVTGVLYVFELKKLTSGTPHALLGLAMLPIALGLFALTGWILANLVVEDKAEPSLEDAERS